MKRKPENLSTVLKPVLSKTKHFVGHNTIAYVIKSFVHAYRVRDLQRELNNLKRVHRYNNESPTLQM
ncbi:MAG: hypothetical protein FWE50_00370 [Alphaproteobacteria bacterium]|nr:hypothetical protein [Alphaproteobacteria bacterium]